MRLMNNTIFGKNFGKCEKTQIYKTCHNRKKNQIFGVRNKVSYYKASHRKFIRNRNETKNIHECTCLFRTFDTSIKQNVNINININIFTSRLCKY